MPRSKDHAASTERVGHWRTCGIGIDTHSQFITVTVVIPDYSGGKEKRHRRNFATDIPALMQAKDWVRQMIQQVQSPTTPLHYTLESSATYHLPLVLLWGDRPSIINPAHAKLGARKTDDIDSGSLADQDLHGRWPVSYVHPPALTAARILLKERTRWTRLASTMRKAILSGLNRFGHAFQTLRTEGIDPYPVVEDFLRTGQVALAEAHKCVGGIPIPKELADYWIGQLVAAAASLQRAKQHHQAARAILQSQRFETLQGSILGKELLKLVETVPGVGPVTAATFVAEVGSIGRFFNAKSCVARAGFDPSLKVSAGKVTAHVTRGGHRHLHWLICEAAGAALRTRDSPLGRWGLAIARKQKKGGYQKATGAVGRRIVEGLYHVWSRAEGWQATRHLERHHGAEASGEPASRGGAEATDGERARARGERGARSPGQPESRARADRAGGERGGGPADAEDGGQ